MKRRHGNEPADGSLLPGAAELKYLREVAGITRQDHAARLGHKDDSTLRKLENGDKLMSRGAFVANVEPIGHGPEAVDVLLALHPLVKHLPPQEPPSPVALRRDELARLDRACLGAAAGLLECLRPLLIRERKRLKAEEARREAADSWAELQTQGEKERRRLVETWPKYRTWAVALQVCEASIKAAADRADRALELALFALFVAERVEESLRARTLGYCWGHVGNARRVGEDFDGADRDFARAWELWYAGAGTDPDLLPEWKLFSLEASLRREQHRFPEALERLGRAKASSGDDKLAVARILMKRCNVFHQMGEPERALAVLAEAASLIEETGDPQLLFALRFNRADLMLRLKRFEEGARLLPQVRDMAIGQRNGLNLTRVDWLEAKSLAGLGRKEEAMHRLEKVRDDFTAHKHPYDAALSSLDLALLKQEAGLTAEVRWLATGLFWIFDLKQIDREALAALRLFCEAAKQDTATVELTRQVIADIERVRRSAPPFKS